MTTSEYCWDIFATSMGFVAVAAGERGVVASVLPCCQEEEAAAALAAKFTGGNRLQKRRGSSGPGREFLAQAARFLEVYFIDPAASGAFLPPLDLSSFSPFRQEVYRVVLAIPPGETRSYGEVAQACGKPGGARAVGRALAVNPMPLFIPCHRVTAVRGIGGFTGAPLAVKVKLLEWERGKKRRKSSLF
ncbi:MAG: methylated-DNA-[protein]-cysteine S-methyltransferase [Eubacteriales bacterium]|nr:methylated-DNA-[protein]-cysteine S-methyltransferase [Eubacteriales bacterium]